MKKLIKMWSLAVVLGMLLFTSQADGQVRNQVTAVTAWGFVEVSVGANAVLQVTLRNEDGFCGFIVSLQGQAGPGAGVFAPPQVFAPSELPSECVQ